MNVRALSECSNIVIGQINHAAQSVQRLLHVIDFLRHHFYLVDSAVECQRDTVTVVDNAAALGAIGTSLMRFSLERVW